MIQIGLIVVGIALAIGGITALIASPKPGAKKTQPGVAVAMIILGVGVVAFALIGLPMMVSGPRR